jgi:integrase
MAKQNLLDKLTVKNANCPNDKLHMDYADGGNLFLRVYADYRKNWLVRLYRDGKNYARGCGLYPEVSLYEARERRDSFKKLWEQGIDPMVEKKKVKHSVISQKDLTFGKAYKMYLENKVIPNLSEKSLKRTKEFYNKYLKIPLEILPLIDVNDEVLLAVLETVHDKAPSSAIKVKSLVNQIFIHMKEKRLFKSANPTLELQGNSLIKPPKRKHMAHLEEHRVGEFLTALENDKESGLTIRTFVYVVMVTALRTGSLANAKWKWLDSKANTLTIPSLYMKGRQSFRCPLPKQAMDKLNALKALLGKNSIYIFEGLKNKPISDATARLCVQRLTGDKTTVHGFRTLFNIVVSKMNKFEIEKIEAQLTHAFTSTDIRKVYMGKEDYLDDRRKIVQAYADWCDKQ